MEFPNQPTVLPAAQRHTETFVAEQGRAFQGGDIVTLHIPPTDKTYITKDAKLHFDFDMTYKEGTTTDYYNLFKGSPTYVQERPWLFQEAFSRYKTGTITLPTKTGNWFFSITVGAEELSSNISAGTYTVSSMITALNTATQGSGAGQMNKPTVHWGFQNGRFIVRNTTLGTLVNIRGESNVGPYLGVVLDTTFGQSASAPNPPLFDSTYNNSIYIPGDKRVYLTLRIDGGTTIYKAYLPTPPVGSTGQTLLIDDVLEYLNAQNSTIFVWYFDNIENRFYVKRTGGTVQIWENFAAAEALGFYTVPSAFAETVYADTHPHSQTLIQNLSFDAYRSYPALDTNGAYGFIRDIEVYDYMGSTLLEKVPRHDILTSILMDFETVPDQMQIPRPYQSENNNLTVRKQPCSYLFEEPAWPLQRDAPIYFNWNVSNTGGIDSTNPVYADTLSIPKMHFVIDLHSFLGKLSQKFVPLHNGFTLKFQLNKTSDVVAFNTQLPNNTITMKFPDSATVGDNEEITQNMNPSISSSSFSNVYLKCDLITVSPEMDSKIDKTVFTKAFKYSLDTLTTRTTRIPVEVASLTSVLIGQRPNLGVNSWSQKFGFRVKNYIEKAQLLFNKAVVKDISSPSEAYEALKEAFEQRLDWWINRIDWNVDVVDQANYTCGMQGNVLSDTDLVLLDADSTSNFVKTYQYGDYHGLTRQGKFLLAMDTRLPGYQQAAVCGIDTRKELLEYRLVPGSQSKYDVMIDVFAQFDAFIVIRPGEATSVAF